MTQLSTETSYKYLTPTQPLIKPNRREFAAVTYTVITFIISLILIGLGMRLLFAFFVMDNAFTRGITIFTEPFIAPFTRKFPDSHEMLQISTASAFTGYYIFYGIMLLVSKVFSRQKASAR